MSIKFSKRLIKQKKEYGNNLINEIHVCCSTVDLTPQDKSKLFELQSKLDLV